MVMPDQSNPRKVTTCGGMTVVSLNSQILEASGLEEGDRVTVEPIANGFIAKRVEWVEVGGGDE